MDVCPVPCETASTLLHISSTAESSATAAVSSEHSGKCSRHGVHGEAGGRHEPDACAVQGQEPQRALLHAKVGWVPHRTTTTATCSPRDEKSNPTWWGGVYSLGIATLTLAYASVPLYRAICQRTGWGGIPITDQTRFTPDKLIPVQTAKRIRVTFAASVSDVLEWKFTPQQREVRVLPGETALAFYTATNNSPQDIIGVATYSVTPGQVAPYFSKIQCFCFEEQKLNAGETVDMPVFFFIDPDFYEDPAMRVCCL